MNLSKNGNASTLLLASVALVACAGSPQRTGRGDLRLDTETVSRIRHAAAVGEDFDS